MGKGARVKKERALREQQKKEWFEQCMYRDVAYIKMQRNEFQLRKFLAPIPQEIATIYANLMIQDGLQESKEDYNRRYAKGERNFVVERHGHLLAHLKEFSDSDILGYWRRRLFYALKIDGEVGVDKHMETFNKPGFLLPYVYSVDWLHWNRWEYWLDIMNKGTLEGSGPIPPITWCHDPSILRTIRASLSDCVNYGISYGCTLEDFVEWILFGLRAAPKHPDIPPEVNLFWLKSLGIDLMIRYPNDYLTWLLIEFHSRDVIEEREVSQQVVDFKEYIHRVEREMEHKSPEQRKMTEIYEDEVGCGTALLPYANYTFFAGGGSQDPLAMKMNKIQMILYAPWYAQNPFREEVVERDTLVDAKELIIAMVNHDAKDDEWRIHMYTEEGLISLAVPKEAKELLGNG